MPIIIWTDSALEDTLQNIEYLEKEWTEKEVQRFIQKSNDVLDKLTKENVRFKPTEYKNTFQIPILKQITLFYEKEDDKIILLRFWNTHQNPDKFVL